MYKQLSTLLFIVFFLLVFVQESPAPISGGFPGLDTLIEESTDIVIADFIKTHPIYPPDMGGYDNEEFRIVKVLKGNYTENTIVIFNKFRFLMYSEPTLLMLDYKVSGRYIIFLKNGTNINAVGSSIRISSNSNVQNIDINNIKQVIVRLIKEYVEYKEEELELIKKNTSVLLGEIEPYSNLSIQEVDAANNYVKSNFAIKLFYILCGLMVLFLSLFLGFWRYRKT